ncbi:hypothetical protein [Limisalsivibrio acetivorans]|uniref:hypothetical protein n=1 Tax=Limisalsivibrio acetivorans TaxID=1304888 RepID=UPI0003B42CD4|nr:hypothetical protein [Limisalsivibrio acetivorans]
MSEKDDQKIQAVEIKCVNCDYTQIIYLPKEQPGRCPECGGGMIISEILEEGKSY